MRIGVDLDGVVADFTQGWTSQYRKDFGKEIQEKDITEWGLSQPLTHFEEEIDFWNWAKNFNGYSIFRNLKTYKSNGKKQDLLPKISVMKYGMSFVPILMRSLKSVIHF